MAVELTFPPALKDTEIGLLPEDWQVLRLGDLADLRLGRTPARKEARFWTNGSVPWVSIGDLNNRAVIGTRELISEEAFRTVFGGRLVPAGTLLLSFELTIGKVGVLAIGATHNEAIASVVPHASTADRDFLRYVLPTLDYDSLLDPYVKGRTLNRRKLLSLAIPLPPVEEQRAIARVLSTIQRAIEATDKVIAAARQLKRSLMRHLFTYGPVPVAEAENVPLKETEIGPLPADWQISRLGDLADLRLGRTPARKETRFWANGSVPWVSIGDLNNGAVTGTRELISEEAFRTVFGGRLVPAGTLLLSFKLTIGKVGVLAIDATHNEAIASVVPQASRADRRFLQYLLPTLDYDSLLDPYVKGRTLNRRKLLSLPIPLPPVEEQQAISLALMSASGRIEAEEKRRAALKELFRTMLHLLMTGQLRVKPARPGGE